MIDFSPGGMKPLRLESTIERLHTLFPRTCDFSQYLATQGFPYKASPSELMHPPSIAKEMPSNCTVKTGKRVSSCGSLEQR